MAFDADYNYHVHVRASGREQFEMALSLAFNNRWVTAWGDYGEFGLVFFWFHSTVGMFEDPILKSKNEVGEYILHRPKKFQLFYEDHCVGDVLDMSWEWLHTDPDLDSYGKFTNIGFDITTDTCDNQTDIMCAIRRYCSEC